MCQIEPVSVENELKCWLKLKEICLDIEQKFLTSIKEDEALLSQGQISQNVRNCIVYRLGEKQIIEELRIACD